MKEGDFCLLHGVFLEIFTKGILLQGPSGVGKSDSALQLLDRGHRLIADDMVIFHKLKNALIGSSPPALQNLLEIRGLGIVNVATLFNPQITIQNKPLDFVIQITPPHSLNEFERRTQPKLDRKIIKDLSFLQLHLSLAFTGNMAILIESAVKFMERQTASCIKVI